MNKKHNYYKILRQITNINSNSKDITNKVRIIRQIIENHLYHQFNLNTSINNSPICKQTFYNYINKVSSNINDLKNKSRAPHKTRLKYCWDDIVSFAIKKREQKYRDFKPDIRTLTNIVNNKFNIKVSHSQLSTQIQKRSKPSTIQLPQVYKKYEVWTLGYVQMDGINAHKHMRLNQKMHIFTAIDQYSRSMFAYCYDEQTKSNAIDFLHRAKKYFATLGIKIKHVRTDNGLEWVNYKDKRKYLSSFQLALHNEFISHDTTQTGSPYQNGKVERLNQTMQNQLIKQLASKYKNLTVNQMNTKVENYIKYYNFEKYHSTLKKIPYEVVENFTKYGIINEHVFE